MSWLKRKLREWLNNDDTEEPKLVAVSERDTPDIEGMRFTMMRAVGGIVLQTRVYDRRRDESNSNTYIITDDEPLAERIGQIVSMESLKI